MNRQMHQFKGQSKFGLVVFLAAAVVMLQGVSVQAIPIPSDLTIYGEVEFDDGFAYAEGVSISSTGSFSKTVGGAITSSTFDGDVVTGDNPQAGTLTDLGDGFGIITEAYGFYDPEFGVGLDLVLDVTNNSLTVPYVVTFQLDFSNSVTAYGNEGDDVFVHSEFTLDDPTDEIFFTDLLSDAYYGNEVGGDLTGGYGGNLSESGTRFFDILLGPGETFDFDGALTIEGGVFDLGLQIESHFDLDFIVADIEGGTIIPAPGAALLGSIGVACVCCLRRRLGDHS